MWKIAIAVIALAIPHLRAQTTAVTSPPGYLTTAGARLAPSFGITPEARYMFLDGRLRDSPLSLIELAFRQEELPSQQPSVPRRWAQVSLSLCNTNVDAASNFFSRNRLSTPTEVFSAGVAWPPLQTPTSGPAPWGGPNGGLLHPFATPWASTRGSDTCYEFEFRGGTLTNGSKWLPNVGEGYFLDTYVSGNFNRSPTLLVGRWNQIGCMDSASTIGLSAVCSTESVTYSLTHPDRTLRGQHRVSTYGSWGPPSSSVIYGLSLSGSKQGVVFPGVGCNRLHLDLTSPTFFASARTDWSGNGGMQWAVLPFNRALIGLPLWSQFAWSDTRTGAPLLSAANLGHVVGFPDEPRRKVTHFYSLTAAAGFGPDSGHGTNPIFRLTGR